MNVGLPNSPRKLIFPHSDGLQAGFWNDSNSAAGAKEGASLVKLSPYTHGIIAIEYTHSVRSIYAEASLSALSAARSVATSRLKSHLLLSRRQTMPGFYCVSQLKCLALIYVLLLVFLNFYIDTTSIYTILLVLSYFKKSRHYCKHAFKELDSL